MQCYLCGSNDYFQREGSVRDNPDIKILECNTCGLVFLNKQETNDGYYENGKMYRKEIMSLVDTYNNDNLRRIKQMQDLLKNANVLDFGSGYGGFLILAKQYAKSVVGVEINKQVETIYKKNNILLYRNLEKIHDETLDIITLFHCIAHIHNPIDLLNKLYKKLKPNGKIIIETPNANDALLTLYKNKGFVNFFYHTDMLYMFNSTSLSTLIKKTKLKIDFIKHIQRYPISNTLYWLNNNLPAGQKYWGSTIDNENLQNAYEQTLASIGASDTIFAQFIKE